MNTDTEKKSWCAGCQDFVAGGIREGFCERCFPVAKALGISVSDIAGVIFKKPEGRKKSIPIIVFNKREIKS